jgi:hypothetical protein
MAHDIHLHAHLAFPKSLPQFQRLFPTDDACAAYLEAIRWEHGFACPHCGVAGEPFRPLLGIGTNGEGPTYAGLYSGDWKHHTMASRHG